MTQAFAASRRRFVSTSLYAAMALAMGGAHAATDYPTKPATLLVGFSAGGAVDQVARLVGQGLAKDLGQSFVVENRAGATGTIAADLVARAKPDGYTLLLGTQSTMVVAPGMYPKLRFDPVKDFAPVSLIASVPLVLVVHPSLPLHTVQDVIKYAREKNGTLNYASSGPGGPQHVAAELFATMAGVQMVHVPYKGEANAIADVLGNQVPLMFSNLPTLLPHIRSGKLRAIAVSSLERAPSAPSIPTVSEAGLKGFEALTWFGLYAPAGTPTDVVQKLEHGVKLAMANPDTRAKMAAQGMKVEASDSATFRQYMASESVKWGDLVRKSGIKPE
ncbi:tripartite tricarboxylate transporter substrate binding protein [Cupriavidus respiraculi]|uniref:Bug family tripartite tricarboxylate transporter substrate binding protein n=1 Tax=Cupriavidus respiraculi TaxID=195930 RepID=UPI001C95A2C8|nr:tripartite tricarboxylate transporter substrate binding protein [Cupriavidus respiraculi]MBY4947402.1 tripartite tricarboxylate transporter substrate binding protein [Cupriavidus respiraculi]